MYPCYNMATTMKSSSFENDIVLAAKAGFRHIELRKEKMLDYLRRGHTLPELKQLLEDNQIKPICINALADISFHKGQARETVKEFCHMLCYAGQLVGCRDLEVIAAFGAPTDDREAVTAETATTAVIAQILSIGKKNGVKTERAKRQNITIEIGCLKVSRSFCQKVSFSGCVKTLIPGIDDQQYR